jgi:hypothetical protein
MPQAASRDPIYRRRRYSSELIEQCVRWYLTYRLSYRDLTAMMAEREDGNAASHLGLLLLGEEDSRWRRVKVRARRYLNNVIEQDHRAIKQRSRPMLGLKSFHTAAVTFLGLELAHRIRKRQFILAYNRNGRALSLKDLWDQALSGASSSDTLDTSPPPLMHQISRRPRRRARRGRNGVVRYRRRVSFGQSLYLQVSPKGRQYWHYRYRFEGGRSSFPWGDIPTSRSRTRGRNATQRGTSLKRASIPAARSMRCVEFLSIVSDQISRTPSSRNDSFRPILLKNSLIGSSARLRSEAFRSGSVRLRHILVVLPPLLPLDAN